MIREHAFAVPFGPRVVPRHMADTIDRSARLFARGVEADVAEHQQGQQRDPLGDGLADVPKPIVSPES